MEGVKALWAVLNVLAVLAAVGLFAGDGSTAFQETSLWTLWLAVNSVFVVGLLFRIVGSDEDA